VPALEPEQIVATQVRSWQAFSVLSEMVVLPAIANGL